MSPEPSRGASPTNREDGPVAPRGAPPTESCGEHDEPLIEADVLVEDISIDGMCGVY